MRNFESGAARTPEPETSQVSSRSPETSAEGKNVLSFLKKLGQMANQSTLTSAERERASGVAREKRQNTNNEAGEISEEHRALARKTLEKSKGNKSSVKSETPQKIIAGILTVAAVAAMFTAGFAYQNSKSTVDVASGGGNPETHFVGDNGVHSDYEEYQSPEKLGKHNFGKDLSEYHGDRDGMVEALLEDAYDNPEMLSSLYGNIATDFQKQRDGLANMNINDLDNSLNGENGGETQDTMFGTLSTILRNPDTQVDFVTTNNRVAWSDSEIWKDENKDGVQTFSETRLGTSQVYRVNAPQFVVTNTDEIGGSTITIVNERCGGQVDTQKPPEGVEPGGDVDESIDEEEEEEEETTTVAPKDSDNLKRIDDQINKDIAEDIGTGEVIVDQATADDTDKTPPPKYNDSTKSPTQQNNESKKAEQVTGTTSNYGEDKNTYNYTVQPDNEGQQKANDAYNDEAPTGEALQDAFDSLGIN